MPLKIFYLLPYLLSNTVDIIKKPHEKKLDQTNSQTDLLSCKKKQNISLRFLTHVDLHNCTYSSFQIVSLGFRRVKDFYRMCTTGNTHQRSIVKVLLQ